MLYKKRQDILYSEKHCAISFASNNGQQRNFLVPVWFLSALEWLVFVRDELTAQVAK